MTISSNHSGTQIEDWPHVSIQRTNKLPNRPGIYAVIGAEKEVLYIGRSTNLRRRWRNHDKKKDLEGLSKKDLKIAYCEIENTVLLPIVEEFFIAQTSPRFNKTTPREPKNRFGQKVKITLMMGCSDSPWDIRISSISTQDHLSSLPVREFSLSPWEDRDIS